ncbi:hypothetical protein QWJ20_08770 [Pectobacterium sp. S5]|uniref:hypothetical protein n=1 Tax=Pectobacterium TaxID=122277 RepID=UPI003D9BB629
MAVFKLVSIFPSLPNLSVNSAVIVPSKVFAVSAGASGQYLTLALFGIKMPTLWLELLLTSVGELLSMVFVTIHPDNNIAIDITRITLILFIYIDEEWETIVTLGCLLFAT